MAKNSIYKVLDFGDGWATDSIAAEMSKVANDGWTVIEIMSSPTHYEVSRRPDEVPGLNDGDTVFVRRATRARRRSNAQSSSSTNAARKTTRQSTSLAKKY